MANTQATSTSATKVNKDLANNRVTITRTYNATPDKVWHAWTNQRELEKWFAPEPYRIETKSFEFRPDGKWLFAMVGPNGDKQWGAWNYTKIDAPTAFEATDNFTDEHGVKKPDSFEVNWHVQFSKAGQGTKVEAILRGITPDALEKMLETGFEDGMRSILDNLDEQLS
jgi:uncharacterized protein YndB with AHSA1/START domain